MCAYDMHGFKQRKQCLINNIASDFWCLQEHCLYPSALK